jgi:hypothetical protein
MARKPPLRTRSGGSRKKGRKRPCWRARCSRFFFGGARGGGKTDGMLGEWASHADLHGKNAVGLMVRRERVQLLETIERSRQIYGPIGARYNDQDKMWRWPNGARLRFAYLERDADADAYPGAQLHASVCRGAGHVPERLAGSEADGNVALWRGCTLRVSGNRQPRRARTPMGQGALYRPQSCRMGSSKVHV